MISVRLAPGTLSLFSSFTLRHLDRLGRAAALGDTYLLTLSGHASEKLISGPGRQAKKKSAALRILALNRSKAHLDTGDVAWAGPFPRMPNTNNKSYPTYTGHLVELLVGWARVRAAPDTTH